jgi:transposase-like protein
MFIPLFPESTKDISSKVGVYTIDDMVYYFNGSMPFFHHGKKDYQSFKMITSQLIVLKLARQVEVCGAFKISKEGIQRWVKQYRKEGPSSFYKKKKTRSGGTIITPEVLTILQSLLNQGKEISEISKSEGIKSDTIRKAIQSGRLTKLSLPIGNSSAACPTSTASQRNLADKNANMGMACTNEEARIEAIKKKRTSPAL